MVPTGSSAVPVPSNIRSRRQSIRGRPSSAEREDDVFGGPGAWDNAQKTKVQCPAEGCNGDEAAFFQVQIRSADEPMTSFAKVGLPLAPRLLSWSNGGDGAR